MPTAAKLVAAVLFGALAWAASRLGVPLFPDGTDPPRFAEVNAALGAGLGWRMAGSRGPAGGAGQGLTTVAALSVAALAVHGAVEMVRRSLRRAYDGPVEALEGLVGIMAETGRLLAEPRLLGTLLVGGAAAGLVTGWVGRRFS